MSLRAQLPEVEPGVEKRRTRKEKRRTRKEKRRNPCLNGFGMHCVLQKYLLL